MSYFSHDCCELVCVATKLNWNNCPLQTIESYALEANACNSEFMNESNGCASSVLKVCYSVSPPETVMYCTWIKATNNWKGCIEHRSVKWGSHNIIELLRVRTHLFFLSNLPASFRVGCIIRRQNAKWESDGCVIFPHARPKRQKGIFQPVGGWGGVRTYFPLFLSFFVFYIGYYLISLAHTCICLSGAAGREI